MQSHDHVPVSSIVLNPSNFRHRLVSSQDEALQQLFGDSIKRRQMLTLATDIAERGLDPSNLPILEPIDGYWRVLEGNRRIAALKVMGNPDVLPPLDGMSESELADYRAHFARLGASSALPRRVFALVTDDEALARHLIYLKHTGATSHRGAGTITWGPEGIVRYENAAPDTGDGKARSRTNPQAAMALALLDALNAHFPGDEGLLGQVERARKGGLTALGRLLVKRENRLRLGLQFEEGVVRFLVGRDALRAVMLRILTELGTDQLNTRTTNTADQVTGYLDGIEDDLPSADDRLEEAEPPGAPDPAAASTKPKKKRRRQERVMRRVFKDLTLHHASQRTRAILAEMKTIPIDSYPNTLAVMMRVLIDLYTDDVFRALDRKPEESPYKRAKKCLELLEPNGNVKNSQYPHIHRAMATGIGDLAIDTMHGFVHRTTFNPTPDTIRTQAIYYEPWLKALDDHVEETLTKGQQ